MENELGNVETDSTVDLAVRDIVDPMDHITDLRPHAPDNERDLTGGKH